MAKKSKWVTALEVHQEHLKHEERNLRDQAKNLLTKADVYSDQIASVRAIINESTNKVPRQRRVAADKRPRGIIDEAKNLPAGVFLPSASDNVAQAQENKA